MLGEIQRLLAPHGAESFGVCRFADCLPLLPCRAAARIPEGAQSVIVCLFPYNIGPAGEHPRRNVARYAVLDDYHGICTGILSALAEGLALQFGGAFAAFVDSSPLHEVEAAVRAGLGVRGRHGLLLHPRWGSTVFIGELVTTLAIPPTSPQAGSCSGCGRCTAACPTGAIADSRPFQKERCRSFISQKKGALTQWEEQQLREGALAWGCDLCVGACPAGIGALSPVQAFYHAPAPVLTQEEVGPLRKTKPYGYRGQAVLVRNLRLLEKQDL